MATKPKLLIIGTGPGAADLARGLAELGYTAATAEFGPQAVEIAAGDRPDLTVIELADGDAIGGVEAAREIKALSGAPAIFIADEADAETLRQARETGPIAILPKPITAPELPRIIGTALPLYNRATEAEREIEKLRAESKLMKSMFDAVSDGVVAMNSAGEFLLVNSSAEQIAGMGATDGEMSDLGERYGTFHLGVCAAGNYDHHILRKRRRLTATYCARSDPKQFCGADS